MIFPSINAVEMSLNRFSATVTREGGNVMSGLSDLVPLVG
jgi:hypothetical protein